ncbi:MAG: ABC transporter ATP-binding protein, partial [Alphaproteobacteria bacterium]
MARGAERAVAAEPAAIEVRGLVRRFGEVTALDRVSVAVRPGELFSVLGPSGCGKTTLLRAVAGFEAPDAGTVHVGGEDVTRLPPHRRDVNTVFQQYALFPHLSVHDNVAFGPRSHRLDEREVSRRVEEALRAVRLDGLGARRPDQLSGGQRQRVAVARALVNRPSALLLDEPLSALDPSLRREVQGEIKRLQRETGIAFVLVTHDQQEALVRSDRLAVLRAGRLR